MLMGLIEDKSLKAKAVFGLFAAASCDEEIELYSSQAHSQKESCERHGEHTRTTFLTDRDAPPIERLQMLRTQRKMQEATSKNPSLADFVAPKNSGVEDYVGAFCVTSGEGLEALIKKFDQEQDDYQGILIRSLADRLAEAAAEWLHLQIRRDYWGYAGGEKLSHEELVREKYQGIRPAPGYSACPDHTEKKKLFKLLDVTKNTGVTLTHSMAMTPASSVCGWYFSHPEASYFNVGKIQEDQLKYYAGKKEMTESETRSWLSANLL
jgi:5-methyltetrahydrofolate--homocysteine methyltransferase